MKKEKNIRKEKVGNNTYYINEEKKTVVCRTESKFVDCDPIVRFGIAKCSPDDTFDEEFGRSLARKRAVLEVTEEINNTIKFWSQTEEEILDEMRECTKKLLRLRYYREKETQIRKEIKNLVRCQNLNFPKFVENNTENEKVN